jgi:hypothetical protein
MHAYPCNLDDVPCWCVHTRCSTRHFHVLNVMYEKLLFLTELNEQTTRYSNKTTAECKVIFMYVSYALYLYIESSMQTGKALRYFNENEFCAN